MTFEEFENTLQDWLDEGRLDEVATLIPLVCEADRAQCVELFDTYQALFVGLAVTTPSKKPTSIDPVAAAVPTSPQANGRSAGSSHAASRALLALAACLALMAIVPGWFPLSGNVNQSASNSPLSPIEVEPELAVTHSPNLVDATTDFAEEAFAKETEEFSLFATTSIEPLARGMADKTDSAFRSLNEVSRNLNPIDQSLSAYRDAAPLLETLTQGFLPGTRSLSSAFSVLQESASDPVPHATSSQPEPTKSATPENAAVI